MDNIVPINTKDCSLNEPQCLRQAEYISVRDGTKLAAFIYRPLCNGEPIDEPLPVIWMHDRYHTVCVREGNSDLSVSQAPKACTVAEDSIQAASDAKVSLALLPWLQIMLHHGYIVAIVDVRGSGASFGQSTGPFSPEERWDAYDITEWLAVKPWCSGRIGMFGRSYCGISQYLAASTAPPHLGAVFPEMAMCDLYSFAYSGGVFRHNFAENWGRRVRALDTSAKAVAVDQDVDGSLLAAARAEHQSNQDTYELFFCLPYRDSQDIQTDSIPYIERNPASYINDIQHSNIALCHLTGWHDMWVRDALIWFNNLDNPQKLIIGPWAHGSVRGQELADLHLRWFNHWLKDTPDLSLNEPPIHYYTIGAPPESSWRTTWQWPLSNEQKQILYLREGPSRTICTVNDNDGVLSSQAPDSATVGTDAYCIDYSTTSGKATRWTNGYGGPFGYPDMAPNDAKGLTYTSSILRSDVEITGHPVIHLWVTSAVDADFFVYLEDVYPDAYSQYVSEGNLRVSHRALMQPPLNMIGLPFHQSFAQNLQTPLNEPMELVFDLQPISIVIPSGHCIRVTITCADRDNALTSEISPPPTIYLHRSADFPSFIVLPVIPPFNDFRHY